MTEVPATTIYVIYKRRQDGIREPVGGFFSEREARAKVGELIENGNDWTLILEKINVYGTPE